MMPGRVEAEGKWSEIELSGTGESRKSLKSGLQLRPTHLSEEVAMFLEAVDLDDVTLVAHSWSAPVALSCGLLCPELVKRIVLISPFSCSNFTMTSKVRSEFEKLKTAAEVRDIQSKDLFRSLENVPDLMWDEMPIQLVDSSLYSQLSQIKLPVLVLHADNDHIFAKQDAQKLADQFPFGEFIECKKSGHFIQLDRPEFVLEKILKD